MNNLFAFFGNIFRGITGFFTGKVLRSPQTAPPPAPKPVVDIPDDNTIGFERLPRLDQNLRVLK